MIDNQLFSLYINNVAYKTLFTLALSKKISRSACYPNQVITGGRYISNKNNR